MTRITFSKRFVTGILEGVVIHGEAMTVCDTMAEQDASGMDGVTVFDPQGRWGCPHVCFNPVVELVDNAEASQPK